MTSLDRNSRLGLLAITAQIAIALAGGGWAASSLLPHGSEWQLVGPIGGFASLVVGYLAAMGIGMVFGTVLLARSAARYMQDRDAASAVAPGRGDRVLNTVAAAAAMSLIVIGCLATAVVLWLVGDASAIGAAMRFTLLGGVLAALVPRGLHAFG
jgi:hypothetical protein